MGASTDGEEREAGMIEKTFCNCHAEITGNHSHCWRCHSPLPQFNAQMAIKPLFEERADVSISRAQAVYKQRGGEYADTWRSCRFLKMKAVSKTLGIEIKPEHFRALATAAFCDMKYERNAGGYKDDSIIDGINYDAFLAEEMRELGVK